MERFVVGFVRRPHGLSGNVKFESASGEYAHFAAIHEVTLKGKDFEKTCVIERVDTKASFPLMKFAGVDSPEEAKKLSGAAIIVPRDKACPLREGEFYYEDLKQCVLAHTAPDGSSVKVGTITGVLEGGADDLLEVEVGGDGPQAESSGRSAGAKSRSCLVPFNNEFIGNVDIARKTVELRHLWILE
jgi:16S rRNA processing protein RimM